MRKRTRGRLIQKIEFVERIEDFDKKTKILKFKEVKRTKFIRHLPAHHSVASLDYLD
jgi:hypothetical protein